MANQISPAATKKVTVKFQAGLGSETGTVFGLRMIRTNSARYPVNAGPEISAILAPCWTTRGELGLAICRCPALLHSVFTFLPSLLSDLRLA
jgi:hypothetical protein